MNFLSLQFLLLVAFTGAFVTYLLGKISSLVRNFCAVVLSGLLVVITMALYGKSLTETFYPSFLGIPLLLRLNMLSWLFAISVTGISALCIIFSLSYIKGRERTDFYYLMMLLVEASMLGIVLASDMISFFVSWEIMSWSAFLLISYNRGPALAAGMKYIVMSIVGSVSLLIGILSLYASYHTFSISELASLLGSASTGYLSFVIITFCIGFGIKNALVPLHTWLPDAHSEAPAPFSAILSGILIKMGTYGFVLIMYGIAGTRLFLALGNSFVSFHFSLCVLAAVTILVPSFIAVLQNDAKKLLAWSSIAQVGYIILGIAYGTSLGFAGGLFHFFNHAAFKALLFLCIGAVEYRTKTRNLDSLGGLIKTMPVTFCATVIGVCGLIGVPLTNGFVSKWLIYKTLILEGSPFLAFVALIGTWGTILYGYKLMHNIFLGQLSEKHKNIRPAPLSMQLPLIILSAIVVLFGVLPGIVLKIVNTIGISVGYESLSVNIWGIASENGTINFINILFAVLATGVIAWMLFGIGAKSVRVSQEDSYAAGAAIPKDKYHYTTDFYNPLYRMAGPYLKDVIDQFYYWVARRVQVLCDGIRRVYTGDVGNYVIYIILFLALLILTQIWWKPW